MLSKTKSILKVIFCFMLAFFAATGIWIFQTPTQAKSDPIPNLVGTWVGENKTISDKKGYKDWGKKTVEITEQKDRRFRGHFTYSEGTKNFFGVIYPDNKSFTWVATDSKGYNQGRILDAEHIAACYVEAGAEATAGCAELEKKK